MAKQESQNNQQMNSVTQIKLIVQQIFKQINTSTHTNTTPAETRELKVAKKLTYHNYTTWYWCFHLTQYLFLKSLLKLLSLMVLLYPLV